MWADDGIERTGEGLRDGLEHLRTPAATSAPVDASAWRDREEQRQMALVAELMLEAGLRRTESRGGHYRSDHPDADDARWRRHQVFRHG